LPVYQGGDEIGRALDALTAQTFRDWVLIIADNASTDATASIAAAHAALDGRISYVRHDKNLGASANFVFLAKQSTTPYFMWAASDDELSSNFIADCLSRLEAEPRLGLAGGSVRNVDPHGVLVRTYAHFNGYEAASPAVRVARYVWRREIDGKANMIYSIFKTPLVQEICRDDGVLGAWGADMALVAAALARAPYRHVPEAILLKRVKSAADIATARALANKDYAAVDYGGRFPLRMFPAYLRTQLRGMPSIGTWLTVAAVVTVRLVGVLSWRVMKAIRR